MRFIRDLYFLSMGKLKAPLSAFLHIVTFLVSSDPANRENYQDPSRIFYTCKYLKILKDIPFPDQLSMIAHTLGLVVFL